MDAKHTLGLMAWNIPGMKEAQKYCGDKNFYTVKCSTGKEGHDHRAVKKSCKKSTCPTCWPDYVNQEAHRATQRLFEARRLYALRGYDLRHPVHMVVSPPAEVYGRPEPELRATARKIALATGIVGGCIVFHPYRFQGRETIKHEDFKFPLKASQEKYRACMSEDPKYSPHYHIIGFMPRLKKGEAFTGLKSNDLEASTGWTYINFGRYTRKGLPINVFGKIQYELTHVGVKDEGRQGHTLTWFGLVSYNALAVEIRKIETEDLCTVCGSPNHMWIQGDDKGPHIYKKVERSFFIKPEAFDRVEKRFVKFLPVRVWVDFTLMKDLGPGGPAIT